MGLVEYKFFLLFLFIKSICSITIDDLTYNSQVFTISNDPIKDKWIVLPLNGLKNVTLEINDLTSSVIIEEENDQFELDNNEIRLKGVEEITQSVIYITEIEDKISGYIFTSNGELQIESLKSYENRYILYPRPIISNLGNFEFGEALEAPVPQFEAAMIENIEKCGNGTLCRSDIAIDSDFELYIQMRNNTRLIIDLLERIINRVNILYESQVGITFRIVQIIIRTTPGLYTSNTAHSLLYAVRNHWLSQYKHIERDAVQMFTGKNLDGPAVGVAWQGQMCDDYRYSYSLVRIVHQGLSMCPYAISAHEFGHAFSAGHCECPNALMNAYLNCKMDLTQGMINKIVERRNALTCFDKVTQETKGSNNISPISFSVSPSSSPSASGSPSYSPSVSASHSYLLVSSSPSSYNRTNEKDDFFSERNIIILCSGFAFIVLVYCLVSCCINKNNRVVPNN